MRKTLLLLLIPLSMSGQANPKASFEYSPEGFKWNTVYPYEFGSFRSRLGIDFTYKNWTLDFNNHIYMAKGQSYKFTPTRADFFTNLSYRMGNVRIFAKHSCIHPVVTVGFMPQYFGGGYTSFGISYGY